MCASEAKKKKFAISDADEALRRGKANALLQLAAYADKGYQWCRRNYSKSQKDGVVFFQDAEGMWCARMGSQGGGSSADHARTEAGSEALEGAEEAVFCAEGPNSRTSPQIPTRTLEAKGVV